MDITQISGLSPVVPETPNEADLGRTDFLRMLIAQLENQDPLNPQDSTEFTAQLAQFSSLERLISIDDGLEGLTTSQADFGSVLQGLASASLIGRNAVAFGNLFEVDEGGSFISRPSFELAEASTETTVRVYDAREVLVQEVVLGPLSAGPHAIPEAMLSDVMAEAGIYRFEVDALAGEVQVPSITLFEGVIDSAIALGFEPQVSIGQIIVPYIGVQEIRSAEGGS